MDSEAWFWVISLFGILVIVLSLITLRALRYSRDFQEILTKDLQYQIDRIDLRTGFLESRHQFKCDCLKEELIVSPKRRPGRPKKEIENKIQV